MKNILDTLQERGFIERITGDELRGILEKPIKVYAGFDPTSDSLHIGNLVGIVGLKWFQKYGHTPVAIVGGATGMIGDPSGKSVERNLLDEKAIEHNIKGIRRSLETVLDFEHPTARALLLNNFDWFKEFRFIEFLREVGKNFRIQGMLAKDSVRSRLETEEGLSFTEFSYQLLQAYDFLYLNDHYDVRLQIGGSDQWGNITAGCELVRKMRARQVYGLTFPLLTRSDGKKFGKTEEGAIWLNPEKLSPYDFYQYLFRTPDADVVQLMKRLTFMEMEEIGEFEAELQKKDHIPNVAQKRLAEEVTRLVHGEEGVKLAQKITEAAAPGAKTSLDGATLEALSAEIPSKTFAAKEILGEKIVDLFVKTGLLASRSEARRLIANGGAYLNNEKVMNENLIVTEENLINTHFLLLGVGKKKKMVLKIFS